MSLRLAICWVVQGSRAAQRGHRVRSSTTPKTASHATASQTSGCIRGAVCRSSTDTTAADSTPPHISRRNIVVWRLICSRKVMDRDHTSRRRLAGGNHDRLNRERPCLLLWTL